MWDLKSVFFIISSLYCSNKKEFQYQFSYYSIHNTFLTIFTSDCLLASIFYSNISIISGVDWTFPFRSLRISSLDLIFRSWILTPWIWQAFIVLGELILDFKGSLDVGSKLKMLTSIWLLLGADYGTCERSSFWLFYFDSF